MTPYHGSTHLTPDISAAVEKVAKKISQLSLHISDSSRTENDHVKPVVDTLASGEQKVKSSLPTFHKKVRSMMAGIPVEPDNDELPHPAYESVVEMEHEGSTD